MNNEGRSIFVYNPQPLKPSVNMAINRYYLESVKNETNDLVLRIYSHTPGIILGKFQSTKDIDLEECLKNNLEVVRRPTGGSYVYVDESSTLCYSIFLSKSMVGDRNPPEIYSLIIDPLRERLGSEFEVRGNFSLRLKNYAHNGASLSVAGHSMVTSDGACQFDGIVNLNPLDSDFLSKIAHMRTLCYDGKQKFVEMKGKYFDLQGKTYVPISEDISVLDYEKDLLKKMPSLYNVNIQKDEFVLALKNAVKTFSPKLSVEELVSLEQYKQFIPADISEVIDVDKNARGHCFIDFLESDVKSNH